MHGERGSHCPSPWFAGEEINDSVLAHRDCDTSPTGSSGMGGEGLASAAPLPDSSLKAWTCFLGLRSL